MNKFKYLIAIMRAPFLILAPACVLVGVSTAYWQTHSLVWYDILLVFLGGLSAHICINTFNECFDFRSGLDAKTQRTPFSGGSGTLQAHPGMEKAALILACTAFAITSLVGLYFVWLQGWLLLPVGILGLFLLVTYTLWWVYYPVLSLIAPGLGFGVLMVMGTHFALTGAYSWTAFIASLVPTFLVSNLLLLNQFPDVEADQGIGRKHYPITIGRKASSILYGVFLALTYLSIIVGVILAWLPVTCLIALLTILLSWRAFQGTWKNSENIPALVPSMATNVLINLITPVLLSIGLLIG